MPSLSAGNAISADRLIQHFSWLRANGYRVISVDATGEVTVELQHDGPVSGLGWTPDGELLTVVMDGVGVGRGERRER